jgi:hypothetical protein
MSDELEKEISILLQILKGGPNQSITKELFNADSLIRIAIMHRVSHSLLVFSQDHPELISPQQSEKLSQHCRDNAIRSLGQLGELIRVAQGLNQAGIAFVVIKGPQLARMLYGREALKESVDLDIMLVRESDLEQAHVLLSGIGFTKSDLNGYPGKHSRKIFLIAKREVHFMNPASQVHIDLHIRAGANTYLTAGRFRHFFETLETFYLEGQPVTILPPEQYLAYLCYHGSLHQFSRLAWLMDIRAFLRVKRNDLNDEKILSEAGEIKAERSLFLAMTLLHQLFGDEIPGTFEKAMTHKKRIEWMAKICRRMLIRDPGYGLTLPGRYHKLVYMMILIRGFAGRMDLLYGIAMRALAFRIGSK